MAWWWMWAAARTWLWHPDRLAEAWCDFGFDEDWRIVSRPDAEHKLRRFPEVHLVLADVPLSPQPNRRPLCPLSCELRPVRRFGSNVSSR